MSSTSLPLLRLEVQFVLTVVEFINTESSTQFRLETVKLAYTNRTPSGKEQ